MTLHPAIVQTLAEGAAEADLAVLAKVAEARKVQTRAMRRELKAATDPLSNDIAALWEAIDALRAEVEALREQVNPPGPLRAAP